MTAFDLRTDFPFAACGLDRLTDRQKGEFITELAYELEGRVGEEISRGLSEAELEEFSRIHDGDLDSALAWLAEHQPDYEMSLKYLHLLATDHPQPVTEYAASAWLALHRPDYVEIAERLTYELVDECVRRFNEDD